MSLLRHSYWCLSWLLPSCAAHTHSFTPPLEPSEPSEPSELIQPIELAGPKCSAEGPAVEIVGAYERRCGKGDACAVLDLHLQNRTKHALWMLVDARDEFSGYLESIDVLHASDASSPPVWAFTGQNLHQAFALPPGADLVVRNLEYFRAEKQFYVVFFERLSLGHNRQIDPSLGKGLMPVRGDYDMSWLTRSEYDAESLYPLDGKERVSLDTWCTQTLPIIYRIEPNDVSAL